MTIIERIKEEFTIFEEKKKILIDELQKEFPLLFTDSFKQAPKLKSFGWPQYTPFFNDGEPCKFSVDYHNTFINEVNEDYLDDELDFSIENYTYKKIETDEDIRINNELAEKNNLNWYKNKTIGNNGLTYNPKYDEETATSVKQIKEILTSIPDDFFENLFGDHVIVTIYADGSIEKEDYQHD
jgi:hypothetical protein